MLKELVQDCADTVKGLNKQRFWQDNTLQHCCWGLDWSLASISILSAHCPGLLLLLLLPC